MEVVSTLKIGMSDRFVLPSKYHTSTLVESSYRRRKCMHEMTLTLFFFLMLVICRDEISSKLENV